MTVDYKQYQAEKDAFFKKHKYDFKIDTSSMDQYGRYSKVYSFEDGAQWYEAMSPTYETVETEVEVQLVKVPVKVEVKMFRTEFWSTESGSKYYYEKF